MQRRTFLQMTGLLALTPFAHAIEPIKRPSPAKLRLSLAAYSFNGSLALKGKKPPTMTIEDFINYSATLPVDAVELTSYYFSQSSPDYLAGLKGRCTKLGLDVSGSAVGNNFCVTDPAKLEKEIENVKTWIENTARLGGKTLRIFAGTLAKDQDEKSAVQQCVTTIEKCCDHAAKYGVFLALENHGGITASSEQLLSIVKAVKHEWFGVNVDTGNFHTADPYADLAKIAPYAVNVQLKTEISAMGMPKKDADIPKLIGILREANYRGYVALEYEAAEDPKIGVPRAIAEMRKLMS